MGIFSNKKGKDGDGGGGGGDKGMSLDELREWLHRYYLYHIVNDEEGSDMHQNWAQLDKIEGMIQYIAEKNQAPEEVIASVQKRRGPPPPADWRPLSRTEAFRELKGVLKEFGQIVPDAQVDIKLDECEKRKDPYENGIADVRKKLLKQTEKARQPPSALRSPNVSTSGPLNRSGRSGGFASPSSRAAQPRQLSPVADAQLNDKVKRLSMMAQARAGRQPSSPPGSPALVNPGSKSSMGAISVPELPPPQRQLANSSGLTDRAPKAQGGQLAMSLRDAPPARPVDGGRAFASPPRQVAAAGAQLDVAGLAQDMTEMQQELQLLKQTIRTQVDTHKEMIDLQKQQQDFLNEYLHAEERENEVMVRQARLLQRQYTAALEQWQASHNALMKTGSPHRFGSPVHVHAPSPQKSRGVATWLTSIGMEDYVEVFTFNEIDFQSLTMLEDDDLVRMGIQAMGPRKTIMRGIAELARQQIHEAPHTRTRERSLRVSPPRSAREWTVGNNNVYNTAPARRSPARASSPRPNLSAAEWRAHVDSNTGRVYYYNSVTGESKWEAPQTAVSPNAYADII